MQNQTWLKTYIKIQIALRGTYPAQKYYGFIIIIIIYNLYRGKAPVTRSDFQGGPLRVKIKYTKAKNIQYN